MSKKHDIESDEYRLILEGCISQIKQARVDIALKIRVKLKERTKIVAGLADFFFLTIVKA